MLKYEFVKAGRTCISDDEELAKKLVKSSRLKRWRELELSNSCYKILSSGRWKGLISPDMGSVVVHVRINDEEPVIYMWGVEKELSAYDASKIVEGMLKL